MRIAAANLVMALMLACASVYGGRATADEVRLETARDLLCGRADGADSWRLNPALPERLTLPKERLPLDQRTRPGSVVAVAAGVQAKIDALCVHRGELPAAVPCFVPPYSLLSVFCLLIV